MFVAVRCGAHLVLPSISTGFVSELMQAYRTLRRCSCARKFDGERCGALSSEVLDGMSFHDVCVHIYSNVHVTGVCWVGDWMDARTQVLK